MGAQFLGEIDSAAFPEKGFGRNVHGSITGKRRVRRCGNNAVVV